MLTSRSPFPLSSPPRRGRGTKKPPRAGQVVCLEVPVKKTPTPKRAFFVNIRGAGYTVKRWSSPFFPLRAGKKNQNQLTASIRGRALSHTLSLPLPLSFPLPSPRVRPPVRRVPRPLLPANPVIRDGEPRPSSPRVSALARPAMETACEDCSCVPACMRGRRLRRRGASRPPPRACCLPERAFGKKQTLSRVSGQWQSGRALRGGGQA